MDTKEGSNPSAALKVSKVKPGRKYLMKSNVLKRAAEYRAKRDKNNIAVRKSRLKNKERAEGNTARIQFLKADNYKLERSKVTLLKEVQFLRRLYRAHVKSVNSDGDFSIFDDPDEENLQAVPQTSIMEPDFMEEITAAQALRQLSCGSSNSSSEQECMEALGGIDTSPTAFFTPNTAQPDCPCDEKPELKDVMPREYDHIHKAIRNDHEYTKKVEGCV